MVCKQTEGIGTIRSNQDGPQYEDDGLSSDEGETNSEDEDEDSPGHGSHLANLYIPPSERYVNNGGASIEQPSPRPATSVETPVTPTPAAVIKTPQASKPPSPGFSIPKMFPKRAGTPRSPSFDSTTTTMTTGGTPSTQASGSATVASAAASGVLLPSPSGGATPIARPLSGQKSKFRKSWVPKAKDFNFNAANDIMGIVMLEIQGAHDLPKLKNSEYAIVACEAEC